MSLDGRGQRIEVDIKDAGVPAQDASCGGTMYGGPGARDFRRCTDGHVHCLTCGSIARRYGRTHSCTSNCKGSV